MEASAHARRAGTNGRWHLCRPPCSGLLLMLCTLLHTIDVTACALNTTTERWRDAEEGRGEADAVGGVTYARRRLLTLPDVSQREVVVVGSGRSLLGSGLGETIDSFKQVVRFNLFVTKGFEPDVGSKTTTWILSGIRDPNAMPKAELERVTSVLLPLSPIAAKPARIKSTRDRFLKSKAMRKNLKVWVGAWNTEVDMLRKKYLLQEKHVSSGLQALIHFGRRHKHVYFAGFDFEMADHQHYWEQKMKNATCHNMAGEASTLQMMVEQGLIHRLMPAPAPAATAFDEYDPVCKIVCNEQGVCKKLLGNAVWDQSSTADLGSVIKGSTEAQHAHARPT